MRIDTLGVLLVTIVVATGCAAGKAYREGEQLTRAGNPDAAVAAYRRAVQAAPDNADYKIALQRAMLAASRAHLDRAREFEKNDQLEAAIGEYRLASEFDPGNRQAAAKASDLERVIRDRAEAARPKPPIQQLREQARAASAPPALLNFNTVLTPIRFNNASLRDVVNFIASSTGINITYDREVTDRPVTVQLDGVTLEQALNQIMAMNQLSYKIVNDRSIFVFPDTVPKHAQYDEQVVRTFYISHADATELTQILSSVIRLPQMAVQPIMAANKTANTITARATSSVMQILEKMIEQIDKPRAEIVVDVEILEVDRDRAKSYGLNLSQYALGAVFSPEVSPGGTSTSTGPGTGGTATTTTGGVSTPPGSQLSPPPFNLNTISRGVTTADFYLAVPTATIRFLESDNHTRVVAKPQLRGAEGTKLSLNLGSQIPVVSTSYTPIATGGAGVNPLSSYNYKDVGVNIDMTPFVTLEGDIRLDLVVDDSARGPDVTVAGVTVPSFVERKVTTRLRLRDGESNLLAGLVQQNESTNVQGFPGAIHVPVLKDLFSGNTIASSQTEIVILLTPHIVRTHEITAEDLKPLYIGSAGNLGLGGPPPLIASPPVEPSPAPAPAVPPPGQSSQPGVLPGGTTVPPGSTSVPGTVLLPQATPPSVAPAPPAPALEPLVPAAPSANTSAPDARPAAPAATEPPTASAGFGVAQVIISPPFTALRVGGGPYLVPISIADAARLSTVTLTLIYDPTKLQVRTVQEGSFMRTGGVSVAFSQQVSGNRVDIALVRSSDATGATGTGLLAAVLFDAIAPGSATLTLSGAATGPGGTPMGLQFRPVTVQVLP
jgi:general secretion pathway protein D